MRVIPGLYNPEDAHREPRAIGEPAPADAHLPRYHSACRAADSSAPGSSRTRFLRTW